MLTALCSVSSATIHQHCTRIIDAYGSGATYGAKEFKEPVHKAHRQIVDKSKVIKVGVIWEEAAGEGVGGQA